MRSSRLDGAGHQRYYRFLTDSSTGNSSECGAVCLHLRALGTGETTSLATDRDKLE